ncbi:MAG: hypothetical protein WCP20_06165 [Desulfuromonadales bacterium]
MFRIHLSEETRFGVIFILSVLGLLLALLLLNYYMGGDQKASFVEKEKEKTVIVTQAKQGGATQLPPPKSVVSTVREALKQNNYSTTYMEINNASKTAPEYEELRKQLAEENQSRKAPSVRKETAASPTAPIRYFDESTPRNRSADAVYIYFVEITGALMPRFCVQISAKRPLGFNGIRITADNKKIEIIVPSAHVENTDQGAAEWYDVPLDRRMYGLVQAMMNARKVTLTIEGARGSTTRVVTDVEKKGFRNILDAYTALGGNLNYLQDNTTPDSTPAKKRP